MRWPQGQDEVATDGSDLTHVRRMWDEDGASAHLGIEAIRVDRIDGLGSAVATMRVTSRMVNGHLTTHGGMIFALCDSVFALACNAGGTPTVAAGCDIEFLAPTHLGDELLADAREQYRWGRNGLTEVVVHRQVSRAGGEPSGAAESSESSTTPGTQDVAATHRLGPPVAIFRGRSREIGGR